MHTHAHWSYLTTKFLNNSWKTGDEGYHAWGEKEGKQKAISFGKPGYFPVYLFPILSYQSLIFYDKLIRIANHQFDFSAIWA